MAEKIEQLRENGFKLEKANLMVKQLDSKGDRFKTYLYVYLDEINTVYINRSKISGMRTIEESDVLGDHNSLHTSAKNDYVSTMEKLPFLKSRI